MNAEEEPRIQDSLVEPPPILDDDSDLTDLYDLPEDLSIQTPLHNRYSFWCHRRGGAKAQSYEDSMKLVEHFWRIYDHLIRPNDIKTPTDYQLFKEGIKPIWEDAGNRNGGKWMVHLKKGLASKFWEEIVFAIIGEQFDVGNEICGAVLSIRNTEDIISVWNKTTENAEATSKIRDQMRRILKLPPSVAVEYKKHEECLVGGSSYRNPSIVWRGPNGQGQNPESPHPNPSHPSHSHPQSNKPPGFRSPRGHPSSQQQQPSSLPTDPSEPSSHSISSSSSQPHDASLDGLESTPSPVPTPVPTPAPVSPRSGGGRWGALDPSQHPSRPAWKPATTPTSASSSSGEERGEGFRSSNWRSGGGGGGGSNNNTASSSSTSPRAWGKPQHTTTTTTPSSSSSSPSSSNPNYSNSSTFTFKKSHPSSSSSSSSSSDVSHNNSSSSASPSSPPTPNTVSFPSSSGEGGGEGGEGQKRWVRLQVPGKL